MTHEATRLFSLLEQLGRTAIWLGPDTGTEGLIYLTLKNPPIDTYTCILVRTPPFFWGVFRSLSHLPLGCKIKMMRCQTGGVWRTVGSPPSETLTCPPDSTSNRAAPQAPGP